MADFGAIDIPAFDLHEGVDGNLAVRANANNDVANVSTISAG